jgi:Novel STAND NTPase 1
VKGDLLIILDQFEEYFLYHSSETGDGTFAEVFPRVVNDSSLRVHFLISIRDDAVASLDCFKGTIPNLLDNYLRIDHLDRDGAIQAIREPLAAFNSHLPPEQQMTIAWAAGSVNNS